MFVELQSWGWNFLTLNLLLSSCLSLAGAWGICKQAANIWEKKSGIGVSAEWNIVSTCMFGTWFVYGVHHHSLMLVVQGTLRVPFMAILLARLWKFKGFSRTEKTALAICVATFIASATTAWTDQLFVIMSYLGAAATCFQPLELWRRRAVGVLAPQMIAILLSNALLRLSYGAVLNDPQIVLSALPHILIHTTTLTLYFRFRANAHTTTP